MDQRAASMSFDGAKLCDLTRHHEVHSDARAQRHLRSIVCLCTCKTAPPQVLESPQQQEQE